MFILELLRDLLGIFIAIMIIKSLWEAFTGKYTNKNKRDWQNPFYTDNITMPKIITIFRIKSEAFILKVGILGISYIYSFKKPK